MTAVCHEALKAEVVKILGRLRLDAVAGAQGVVGGHGRQPAGGIVLVIGRYVLGGVGFQRNAVCVEAARAGVVLDRADGAAGGVVDGFGDVPGVVGRLITAFCPICQN